MKNIELSKPKMLDLDVDILFNDPIANHTFLMGLQAPEMIVQAAPGQFVMLRLGPAMDPLLRRPFSICGTLAPDVMLILYKVVGKGTSIMSKFEKGDRVTVLGPLGKRFSSPPKNRRVLLTAGGIGIAPLVYLAQQLKMHETILLAGSRCKSEAISLDRLGLGDCKVQLATDDGSAGYRGFVTDLLSDHLKSEKPESAVIYACGPEMMLKTTAGLAAAGRFSCEMSLEANMACGLGACQGCAVKATGHATTAYHLICRDGPIFDYQAIDWGHI
jgi:dihydroorotate dehydrogenase electron transfer subunit